MKKIFFILFSILISTLPLHASTVVGDNLGNHKQIKDLNANEYDILNPGLVDGIDLPLLEANVLTNTGDIDEIRISTGWVETATSQLNMSSYTVKTSSSITGVKEIVWSDGTVQVSSPMGSNIHHGSISMSLDREIYVATTSSGTGIFFLLGSTVTATEARAFCLTAPVGSNAIVNIKDSSGSTILNDPLTINDGGQWSNISISTHTIAKDNHIVLTIEQVGSSTAGSNLMVYLKFWKIIGQ